jgi:hypothetical protein
MFFYRLVSKGAMRRLQSVTIMVLINSPMMKSVVENGMEAKISGLVMVVPVMVVMRFWLGDL